MATIFLIIFYPFKDNLICLEVSAEDVEDDQAPAAPAAPAAEKEEDERDGDWYLDLLHEEEEGRRMNWGTSASPLPSDTTAQSSIPSQFHSGS